MLLETVSTASGWEASPIEATDFVFPRRGFRKNKQPAQRTQPRYRRTNAAGEIWHEFADRPRAPATFWSHPQRRDDCTGFSVVPCPFWLISSSPPGIGSLVPGSRGAPWHPVDSLRSLSDEEAAARTSERQAARLVWPVILRAAEEGRPRLLERAPVRTASRAGEDRWAAMIAMTKAAESKAGRNASVGNGLGAQRLGPGDGVARVLSGVGRVTRHGVPGYGYCISHDTCMLDDAGVIPVGPCCYYPPMYGTI